MTRPRRAAPAAASQSARPATPPVEPEWTTADDQDAEPAAPAEQRPALSVVDGARTIEDELAALLVAHGAQQLTVQIERKADRFGAHGGYLGTLEPTPDLVETVRGRWGGGTYLGKVRDTQRIRGHLRFTIAGKPRDPGDEDDAAPSPAAQPVPDAASSRLDRLESMLERVLEVVATRSAAPAPVDELARLKATADLLRTLTPAPAPPPPPAAVSTLKEFLELQDLLDGRGGRGDGDSFAGVVREALPPLVDTIKTKLSQDAELLQMRREDRARAMRRAPVATVPAPVVVTPGDQLSVLLAGLPGYAVEYLANMAAMDKDAELYAELVLDRLPSDVADTLPTLLAGEDIGARMAAIVPAWAPYPAWFGELAAALLEHQAEQAAGDLESDVG